MATHPDGSPGGAPGSGMRWFHNQLLTADDYKKATGGGSGGSSTGGVGFRIGAGVLSDPNANTYATSIDAFRKTLESHPDWVSQAYAFAHGGKTASPGSMFDYVVKGAAAANKDGMTYAQYHGANGSGGTSPSGGGGRGGGGGGGGGGTSGPSSSQVTALDTIEQALYQYGLTNLTDWATNKVMNEGNIHPADILMQMRGTPEYQQRFPGQAARTANGLPPIAESDYIALERAYSETARNYKLPDGFLSPQEIGILIGHDVSKSEFDARVINGYSVAMNAPKETRDLLKSYYGVHSGHLAAYYLDPTRAKDLLMKQTQAAVAGTEAQLSGFGSLGKGTAQQIAKQTIGTPSNMNADYYRSQFAKIAPLKQLEQAQIGQMGQATVSKKELVGSAFAGAIKGVDPTQAQRAIQLAEQSRTASLQGGGGYAQTAKGGLGIGSASTEGTGK